jgi:L-threonylcarbamoyladenylate synthase
MERFEVTPQNQDEAIAKAIKVLNSGGIIVFPTETAYGLGALADNPEAVGKLLNYKRRPAGKAVSIAVPDQKTAEKYVELNAEAKHLYREFLPGPVTVISKSKGKVDARLESEQHTLGIRIPAFEFTLKLLSQLDAPLTSTSANPAGRVTPYSINDVIKESSKKQLELIGLALDYGDLPHNPTSTVVDTTSTEMQVLRQGELQIGKKYSEMEIKSEAQMIRAGEELINSELKILKDKSLLLLLDGELGTGKTHFTKGIAKGLGIKELVSSPTYTLINEYDIPQTTGKLVHIDAWRLEGQKELKDLQLEQYFKAGNVIALEWSAGTLSALQELIHKNTIKVIELFLEYITPEVRTLKIYTQKD